MPKGVKPPPLILYSDYRRYGIRGKGCGYIPQRFDRRGSAKPHHSKRTDHFEAQEALRQTTIPQERKRVSVKMKQKEDSFVWRRAAQAEPPSGKEKREKMRRPPMKPKWGNVSKRVARQLDELSAPITWHNNPRVVQGGSTADIKLIPSDPPRRHVFSVDITTAPQAPAAGDYPISDAKVTVNAHHLMGAYNSVKDTTWIADHLEYVKDMIFDEARILMGCYTVLSHLDFTTSDLSLPLETVAETPDDTNAPGSTVQGSSCGISSSLELGNNRPDELATSLRVHSLYTSSGSTRDQSSPVDVDGDDSLHKMDLLVQSVSEVKSDDSLASSSASSDHGRGGEATASGDASSMIKPQVLSLELLLLSGFSSNLVLDLEDMDISWRDLSRAGGRALAMLPCRVAFLWDVREFTRERMPELLRVDSNAICFSVLPAKPHVTTSAFAKKVFSLWHIEYQESRWGDLPDLMDSSGSESGDDSDSSFSDGDSSDGDSSDDGLDVVGGMDKNAAGIPEEASLRREASRWSVVATVKRGNAYVSTLLVSSTGHLSDEQRPLTPDPLDRSMSKRTWEAMVKHWRQRLIHIHELDAQDPNTVSVMKDRPTELSNICLLKCLKILDFAPPVTRSGPFWIRKDGNEFLKPYGMKFVHCTKDAVCKGKFVMWREFHFTVVIVDSAVLVIDGEDTFTYQTVEELADEEYSLFFRIVPTSRQVDEEQEDVCGGMLFEENELHPGPEEDDPEIQELLQGLGLDGDGIAPGASATSWECLFS